MKKVTKTTREIIKPQTYPTYTIKFDSVVFEFTPTDADEWQSDGEYDYHFSEEYGEICVYKINDVTKTIHKVIL